MSLELADAYLTLPEEYIAALGGVRWSHGCDALETESGQTLALVLQLQAVLEGVFQNGPPPPFAYVVSLLKICKLGPAVSHLEGLERLHQAYQDVGLAGAGSNCGALIAELCAGLPQGTLLPSWPELQTALTRLTLFGERRRPELAEVPPLSALDFRNALDRRLQSFDLDTLKHWLNFGGAPVAGTEPLAEVTETFPQRLATLEQVYRRRERLVGSFGLVPAWDAVLSLPPRKPTPERLPQGGYSDVTTRGHPDHLLPSQFALDSEEFIRRFAENELLYFQREQPQHPMRPQRWLLLDQGVRTWGRTRLALAGAVMALLHKDPAKHGELQLATTSRSQPFDPHSLSPEVLADELEASDLSLAPTELLQTVLAREGREEPRDIVLLTHPRSLGDPATQRTLAPRDSATRLFVLSVDDTGQAEWTQWGPAGPVNLRKFRVDLDTAEAAQVQNAKPADKPQAPVTPRSPWTGDVEPVPFFFRGGLIANVEGLMAFDAEEEHLLLASSQGQLQLVHLDDSNTIEILPRPMFMGFLVSAYHGLVGVRGGFVLFGYEPDNTSGQGSLWLIHYDLTRRAVKTTALPDVTAGRGYFYSWPDLHCVGYRALGHSEECFAYDLLTEQLVQNPECFIDSSSGVTISSSEFYRAIQGFARMQHQPGNPTDLPILSRGQTILPRQAYCEAVYDTLILHLANKSWATVRPIEQGTKLLTDAVLMEVKLGGDLLAIKHTQRTSLPPTKLLVVSGPDGAMRLHMTVTAQTEFAISASGQSLAVQLARRELQVRKLDVGGGRVVATIGNAGFHNNMAFSLDPDKLTIFIGSNRHQFRWSTGVWEHDHRTNYERDQVGHLGSPNPNTVTTYDRERFSNYLQNGGLMACIDRWGQVLLMDAITGQLIVTVLVRRELAAAALADGTCWASPTSSVLLGGPGDPGAAEKLGRELLLATPTRSNP